MQRFKKVKWTQLPREVLVGHGVLDEISTVCRHLGVEKEAVVVTGSHYTRKVAGERVVEILSDAGYEVKLVEVPGISRESVERVVEQVKETGARVGAKARAKFLLGVGGGSVIDTAKIASFELGVPFVSVPTIASHDGIASPRASVKGKGKGEGEGEDGDTSFSVQADAPLAVVADTEIISSAPFRFTAAGCGDLLANYTAVRDWQLARRLRNAEFSSSAAALSEKTAEMVIERVKEISVKDEQSAWTVLKALVSSGVAISIAGTSAPASGSEHKFSHALDRLVENSAARALHGEQCGVGTIMMSYLYGENWRRIRETLKEIGAPTTAKELGVKDEFVIAALTLAHKINPARYTILGDSGLTSEAAERLAVATGVID